MIKSFFPVGHQRLYGQNYYEKNKVPDIMSNETRKERPQDHAEEDRSPLEKTNIQNCPFFCPKNLHHIIPFIHQSRSLYSEDKIHHRDAEN